jgi:hypothetical protein
MKLLLNDKEIINFLEYITVGYLSDKEKTEIASIAFEEIELISVVAYIEEKKQADKLEKFKGKIYGKIENAVSTDLRSYLDKIQKIISDSKEKRSALIKKKLKYIISKFGEDRLFDLYKNTPGATGFIKSVGLQINKDSEFKIRSTFTDVTADCLLRNTVGNEKILVDKIDYKYPFWFIDSGYTNFLEGKQKIWHRLVRNHMHHSCDFIAPVDRLGMFKEFPRQWREDGEFILVIEPGPLSAAIFHVDMKTWKYEIEKEIRKYSDRPIKFRPKLNKKVRAPLYQDLLNEDYYCLININSNAATESIWAGVPVITLDKHITNFISKNAISDINNLTRPNLANWLCMLSYSQFSYDELVNGTALTIIKKYHDHS